MRMAWKVLVSAAVVTGLLLWFARSAESAGMVFWWSDNPDFSASAEAVQGAVLGAAVLPAPAAPVAQDPDNPAAESSAAAETSAELNPGVDAAETALPPDVAEGTIPDLAPGSTLATGAAAEDPASSGPSPVAGPPGPAHSGHLGGSSGGSDPVKLPEGVKLVTFDDLASFWYEPPDPDLDGAEASGDDQIPEVVRAYHGKRVAVEGYMVPIAVEDGRVRSFILSRFFASCCFGQMPEMNEWVEVDVVGEEGFDYLPYGSVIVTGKFEVGELLDDYGYVRSIYRLKAESVSEQW